jgi:hypothetical protein
MLTGRPASDDLRSSMGTDTETTMVTVIAGYSDSARSMRLRLRFDDREVVMDERPSGITIGRAEENDVVVKGYLSSRLHARIVIGRSNFVLIDQSTNGTFVQTSEGQKLFIRQDILQLKGQGMIGLGCLPEQDSRHTITSPAKRSWLVRSRGPKRLNSPGDAGINYVDEVLPYRCSEFAQPAITTWLIVVPALIPYAFFKSKGWL